MLFVYLICFKLVNDFITLVACPEPSCKNKPRFTVLIQTCNGMFVTAEGAKETKEDVARGGKKEKKSN